MDEISLRQQIHEFIESQVEMVHDPAEELELDLSSITQLLSHDYLLNPYLVYVSAVTHMQALRQRDQRFKFQYFKNYFVEFNGGMFVEKPQFSSEMQSLMRRFTSGNPGFKLLSSSLFDERSDSGLSLADRIKLLITNKFYGPYLMPGGYHTLV